MPSHGASVACSRGHSRTLAHARDNFARDTCYVLLGEWRAWWNAVGRRQLFDLLSESWDPFADATFRDEVGPQVDALGRRLHEGANALDVMTFLHDLRHTRWPNRTGGKWHSRDRAVARKVLAWYGEATGEYPPDTARSRTTYTDRKFG